MVNAAGTVETGSRLRCTAALSAGRMAGVRRRAIFECCKWDPQVGDTPVLADFAITLSPAQWSELAALSGALYAETLAAEREIVTRGGGLLERLALPRTLERVLRNAGADALGNTEAFRVMRFDFHPTRNGWRVTEVNSDVPGGYVESAGFAELMRAELMRTKLANAAATGGGGGGGSGGVGGGGNGGSGGGSGGGNSDGGGDSDSDGDAGSGSGGVGDSGSGSGGGGNRGGGGRGDAGGGNGGGGSDGCDLELAGNPAQKLAACLRERLPGGGRVALVHATAYTDDRQVMVFLRRFFEERGFDVVPASPAEIAWHDGAAFVADGAREKTCVRRKRAHGKKVDALFRFFPVEWLPNLDGGAWKNFFMPAKFPRTLLINPGCAVVSQSKGFPFAWDALSRGAPRTWAALMPETRPLDGAGRGWLARLFRPARLPDAAEWVLKPAMGRVGDGVGLAGATRARDMAGILKNCRRHPRHWAAQRRFESEPLATPHGARHVCVGVYVINGCACGIYGRISPAPLIDYLAQDVAVLVARESGGGAGEAREAAEGRGGAARAALDEGILS